MAESWASIPLRMLRGVYDAGLALILIFPIFGEKAVFGGELSSAPLEPVLGALRVWGRLLLLPGWLGSALGTLLIFWEDEGLEDEWDGGGGVLEAYFC